MGDKKTRKGLDTLRVDIQELTEVVIDMRDKLATQHALSAAEHDSGNNTSGTISNATRELETNARLAHENGAISAYGFFENPAGGDAPQIYRWSMEDKPARTVLNGSISQYAHALAAIGHPQRLNILLMLLSEPATANDVVSQLALGTTGAAYHHLNVLQAAGFVEQQHRGIFTIVLDRIPALLTILASLTNGMTVEIVDHLTEDETSAEPDDETDAYEADGEQAGSAVGQDIPDGSVIFVDSLPSDVENHSISNSTP
ncbi:MAG TPA: winged helix-turn-helix domain-containing protein [Thermomicrobiales bacterium]|nr:winged helix-turn-helix domain-containing protein [Thermomicrobiales bacterium]